MSMKTNVMNLNEMLNTKIEMLPWKLTKIG